MEIRSNEVVENKLGGRIVASHRHRDVFGQVS